MAYMRGEFYIYEGDGSYINIYGDGDNLVSVQLPMETFAELVVMAYEKMTVTERKEAEDRAMFKHAGNISCDPLLAKHGKPTSMAFIRAAQNLV